MNAKLHILGSGSALPVSSHFPTCHILELRDKQFMIDCGEGTQIRMREMGIKTNRLGHIFISHLHGDHCLGLIGLITSFGMLNRTADLHIHAHSDLQKILQPQLDFFCTELSFQVIFHAVNPTEHQLIYEDRSVEVYSIPLIHRVPTCGFLFKEKEGLRHIIREKVDFYQVPVWQLNRIKKGEDFVTEEGETIPNHVLTTDPTPTLSYAYCSDTLYNEKIISIVKDVDWLYHEATFLNSESLRAKKTLHSTAEQAAKIAKEANVKNLIIGHYSTRYRSKKKHLEEAKSVFENTYLAEDKKSFDLK